MRVGWFSKSLKVDVASVRYRCFHMALGLHKSGVESIVYSDAKALIKNLPALDALIVMKRLDAAVIDVVAAAADTGMPIFLDLCDDILCPEYRANRRELHRAVFRGVLPLVDAIVATGPTLSDRIRSYGFDLPETFEIPDVAETRESLAAVKAYAASVTNPSASIVAINGAPVAVSTLEPEPQARVPVVQQMPRRVVWFGNHGVPHSNFGMLSLLGALPALRSVHAETALEFVVISNHREKFDAFIAGQGVPTRYVPWTTEAVFDELQRADVALLTNGDDVFSEVKSANRALQALASGVPVVATSNVALRQLGNAVALDDFEGGLRLYLNDPAAARTAVACGQALIAKTHTDEAAGRRWLEILSRFVGVRSRASARARRTSAERRVLFLIESAADLASLGLPIEETKRNGLNVMVIVTANAGGGSSKVTEFLTRQSIIPTLASAEELEAGDARWLRDADSVVLATESAEPEHRSARALATIARRHKVDVRIVARGADRDGRVASRPLIDIPGSKDTAAPQGSR